MTAPLNHADAPADDQATRLRELVARLDRARDARHEPPARPRAIRHAVSAPTRARTARVLAIASGKGGVGKSNLAVNLCAALARRRLRVILLDGDFGLANADLLCGVRVGAHLGNVRDGDRSIESILIDAPGGFRLAPGASGFTSLLSAPAAEHRRIVDRLAAIESACDAVVIDCGAGMGDGVLAFLAAADLSILVATPEPTAIADTYALIKRFMRTTTGGGVALAPPRLVVNQCEDELEAARVHTRIDSVARRFLGVAIERVGWIPTDGAVPAAVRARRPFVVGAPRSDASRAVDRLALRLAPRLAPGVTPARDGFWRRLFRMRRSRE